MSQLGDHTSVWRTVIENTNITTVVIDPRTTVAYKGGGSTPNFTVSYSCDINSHSYNPKNAGRKTWLYTQTSLEDIKKHNIVNNLF